MTKHLGARITVALLAGALSWVAALSWRGFVEKPLEYTGPALVGAALVALTGAALRHWRLPWYLVLLAQVLVVGIWLHHHLDVSTYAGGWVPTPSGVREVVDQVHAGGSAINTYAAPVRAARFTAPVYLLAVSLLLTLAVDVIAVGLRRPTWAGLPVLVALTVPISTLDDGMSAPVFVVTAVLFAMLLAAVETERVLSWGQAVTGHGGRSAAAVVRDRAPTQVAALKMSVVAAAAALVLPALVPVSHSLLDGGDGKGGSGSGSKVNLENPMADLRRDLVRNDHVPLLDVQTDTQDPTYLRTTVLDQFTGSAWIPGNRQLPASNIARGPLPFPPGVTEQTPGTTSSWSVSTTRQFTTAWLPTPAVTRSILIDRGDWRFDQDTLDITSTGAGVPRPVSYELTSLTPRIDPAQLSSAGIAPPSILAPMTKVPRLTQAVADIAEQVTSQGRSDYAKAVLLQNWFRSEGHFRYSLDPLPGDGMRQLERFITVDKVGYCEQFAAAMAVMARSLGIPARVVVGFLEPDVVRTGQYRFTSDDLHAWPEIYFRGTGWVRFEPTPSTRTGVAPPWARRAVEPTTSATPIPTPTTASRAPQQQDQPTDTASSQDGGSISQTLVLRAVAVLVLVLLLAVPALLRRGQRRRRLASTSDPRVDLENLWRELRAMAVDLRIPWPEGRSPRTVARLLAHRIGAPPDDVADLARVVGLLEQARYRERFALGEEDRAGARRTVARWSRLMAEAVNDRASRSARVLPRSVLPGRLAARTRPMTAGTGPLPPTGSPAPDPGTTETLVETG